MGTFNLNHWPLCRVIRVYMCMCVMERTISCGCVYSGARLIFPRPPRHERKAPQLQLYEHRDPFRSTTNRPHDIIRMILAQPPVVPMGTGASHPCGAYQAATRCIHTIIDRHTCPGSPVMRHKHAPWIGAEGLALATLNAPQPPALGPGDRSCVSHGMLCECHRTAPRLPRPSARLGDGWRNLLGLLHRRRRSRAVFACAHTAQ